MSRPSGVKRLVLVAKPGIVFGNIVSAAGGFFLAARGRPDIAVLVPTLSGIALAVASGCVFNNIIDRDVDRKMVRTRHRVLARRLMTPSAAVCYATVLGLAGTALLAAAANGVTVAIVLAGFGIYVGVYSLWLKRRSIYAPLFGSLAGAAPPLAGYCAVSGRLDLAAVMLLSIFTLWQIPHSHAIAVFRADDYALAKMPVLPLKRKMGVVKNHIVGYIIAFTAAALMPTLGGYAGCTYLAAAALLGLLWLVMALAGYGAVDDRLWAKKVFAFSILTILVLSVMLSVDATVPATSAVRFTLAP